LFVFNPTQPHSHEVIDQGCKQNQETAGNAPAHVKHVAGDQQKPFLNSEVTEATPNQQHRREEENVLERGKDHAVISS
jgi:hypothetical protein